MNYMLSFLLLLFRMSEIFQGLLDELVIVLGFSRQHLLLLLDGIAAAEESHGGLLICCGC